MSITAIFNNLPEDEKRTVLNKLFKDNTLTFTHFIEDMDLCEDMIFCSKCHSYFSEEHRTLKFCGEHLCDSRDMFKYVFCDDCVDEFEPILCETCDKHVKKYNY